MRCCPFDTLVIICLKDFQISDEMLSFHGLKKIQLIALNATSVKEFHLDMKSLAFIMMESVQQCQIRKQVLLEI